VKLPWALAADAPAVVIEANFRPHSGYERAKLSALAVRPVEVYCACPPELAVQRYNARATHPVHVIITLPLEAIAEYDRPIGIGTLVTVDTTVPVRVPAVAEAVRGRHDR
jgi:hypothetical protein